jgi:hypothetical protein
MLLSFSACAAPPTPTPTRSATVSGFVSEEEAFDAAEDTYRAYIDALNRVDLADPATFEPVYAWLTGDALSEEKKSLTTMSARGWSVVGSSIVSGFFSKSSGSEITAVVCLDVSDVELRDRRGSSKVGSGRPEVYALSLVYERASSSRTGLRLARSAAIEDVRCH